MLLSAKGERFIMNEEGFRKNKQGLHVPYKCAAGKWTLGYGEVVGEEGAEKFKDGITEEEAVKRFRVKVKQFVDAMNKAIRVPVTQNQFDALVSLAYNNGADAIAKSTCVRLINNRLFTQAADEFPKWCHCNGEVNKGLVARRKREQKIFNTKV